MRRRFSKARLMIGLLTGLVIAPDVNAPAYANSAFDTFIASVRTEAAGQGVSEKYLAALDTLQPEPEVTRLASSQPEYVKPIWAYLDHLITPNRLILGRENLGDYRQYVDGLEAQYGVPAEIIVAIWGVETNYGSNKGSFQVLQALATLGYEGRRAKFGRQQLLAALQILQSGDVALGDFYGILKCRWSSTIGSTTKSSNITSPRIRAPLCDRSIFVL